jgi:DNA-binding XRE family transcriptional regulator
MSRGTDKRDYYPDSTDYQRAPGIDEDLPCVLEALHKYFDQGGCGMRADPYALTRMGKRIETLRVARRMSRNRLAAVAGLSPRSVSYIEKGSREPMISTIMAIADTLGSTAQYLWTGKIQK